MIQITYGIYGFYACHANDITMHTIYDTGMAHNISLRIDYGSKSGVLKETHGFVACSCTVYSNDI